MDLPVDLPVDLLIVLGLTGVGKSTAVAALTDTYGNTSTDTFTLLPNRRELTDAHLIPAARLAARATLNAVRAAQALQLHGNYWPAAGALAAPA